MVAALVYSLSLLSFRDPSALGRLYRAGYPAEPVPRGAWAHCNQVPPSCLNDTLTVAQNASALPAFCGRLESWKMVYSGT